MGEFYGTNLFLAESSATTGGLDSLLEPTGNIKVRRRWPRAPSAPIASSSSPTAPRPPTRWSCRRCWRPGDIVIVDRNCHKSHHYGMVLAGAQPLLRRSLSADGVLDVRRGAAAHASRRRCSTSRRQGRLDRVRMLDLTNCTFDGHIYNTRRVMEECLAIKPDLIFLWDEAWFGFARFVAVPAAADGDGRGGRHRGVAQDPATAEAYAARRPRRWARDLDPSDAALLDTRLVPDPDKVRLRVYQTNSTHKSMSALRQGSMVLVQGRRLPQASRSSSTRRSSPTPRRRPTSRSSPASTSRAGRWSSRATSW